MIESKVGANPFRFGFIGASDFHNALSTSSENAYAGSSGGIDPATMLPGAEEASGILGATPPAAAPRANASMRDRLPNSGGGLTGVWAQENTRASIFAAFERKETFSTSGERIRVRMFGGWSFEPGSTKQKDWVATAHARGVPMGSDLPPGRPGASPQFAVWAAKDLDGANLDRIQIIKVWLEGEGYREKVFDVALSGGRKVDPQTGKAPAVGNTVNAATGAYANSIGAAELTSVWRVWRVWRDPEFDPAKPAVYYARVLQIPTPRWSTLLAAKHNLPPPS